MGDQGRLSSGYESDGSSICFQPVQYNLSLFPAHGRGVGFPFINAALPASLGAQTRQPDLGTRIKRHSLNASLNKPGCDLHFPVNTHPAFLSAGACTLPFHENRPMLPRTPTIMT